MSLLANENASLAVVSESANGNGTAVNFDTSQPIKDEKLVWVSVDGLNQVLNTHYSVSTVINRITFVTAPATGQLVNIKYYVR